MRCVLFSVSLFPEDFTSLRIEQLVFSFRGCMNRKQQDAIFTTAKRVRFLPCLFEPIGPITARRKLCNLEEETPSLFFMRTFFALSRKERSVLALQCCLKTAHIPTRSILWLSFTLHVSESVSALSSTLHGCFRIGPNLAYANSWPSLMPRAETVSRALSSALHG